VPDARNKAWKREADEGYDYMKFIYSYVKKYKNLVFMAISIKCVAALGELMIPYVLEHIIDYVVPTTPHPIKAKFFSSKKRSSFTFCRTRHSGAPP